MKNAKYGAIIMGIVIGVVGYHLYMQRKVG
jgi:hypothetical protein